mmetsp:Transcript_56540/g.93437  ORF Transcript_56540/g.93437 Transcript_56540/m.93437 type:complete len:136 (-) Transcript_56540:262-669(-)|eukprot:CAMPEP_0119322956 /NCGR_PEP_ID=MMETSP1333-20130426/59602_1 /TAXON_ID=418940 /ORGANISM="Scyphosphaera apsteinii, Strain RCC1455" /LENGTH=135 /DNA_ID=CAMNT_0007330297 /DNA_START=92 /DNA_END=499 /DNA_ORIENTATION=-
MHCVARCLPNLDARANACTENTASTIAEDMYPESRSEENAEPRRRRRSSIMVPFVGVIETEDSEDSISLEDDEDERDALVADETPQRRMSMLPMVNGMGGVSCSIVTTEATKEQLGRRPSGLFEVVIPYQSHRPY